MTETATLALVAITMVVLALLTYAGVRYTRAALEPETADEEEQGANEGGNGPGGTLP
jgi:heme/copper-type cytochrome/quinol oxidase subunit 2